MKEYLKKIDRNTTGYRYDVTPLFASSKDFNELVDDLVSMLDGLAFDFVACVDALGFILGTAIAQKTDKGIITVRKGGKLPIDTFQESYIDYSGKTKTLEIRKDIVPSGAKILIFDEWIETGAHVKAAVKLLEKNNAKIAGVMTINIDNNSSTEIIKLKYKVFSITSNLE